MLVIILGHLQPKLDLIYKFGFKNFVENIFSMNSNKLFIFVLFQFI